MVQDSETQDNVWRNWRTEIRGEFEIEIKYYFEVSGSGKIVAAGESGTGVTFKVAADGLAFFGPERICTSQHPSVQAAAFVGGARKRNVFELGLR